MPLAPESEQRLRDAVAQLGAVVEGLDPAYAMQARLVLMVLRSNVDAVISDPNPRTAGDLEFALGDVRTLVEDLPAGAADEVESIVNQAAAVISQVKTSVALPDDVMALLGVMQEKLKLRQTAIDRATYRDPSQPAESLPADPHKLRDAALLLRDELQRAGFETPMLSRLIDSPNAFYRSDLSGLIDELDVIRGG